MKGKGQLWQCEHLARCCEAAEEMLSLIITAFCPTDCVLGCAARSQWGRTVALISEQQGAGTEKSGAGMPGHLRVPVPG